jgi:hypothetical protein
MRLQHQSRFDITDFDGKIRILSNWKSESRYGSLKNGWIRNTNYTICINLKTKAVKVVSCTSRHFFLDLPYQYCTYFLTIVRSTVSWKRRHEIGRLSLALHTATAAVLQVLIFLLHCLTEGTSRVQLNFCILLSNIWVPTSYDLWSFVTKR